MGQDVVARVFPPMWVALMVFGAAGAIAYGHLDLAAIFLIGLPLVRGPVLLGVERWQADHYAGLAGSAPAPPPRLALPRGRGADPRAGRTPVRPLRRPPRSRHAVRGGRRAASPAAAHRAAERPARLAAAEARAAVGDVHVLPRLRRRTGGPRLGAAAARGGVACRGAAAPAPTVAARRSGRDHGYRAHARARHRRRLTPAALPGFVRMAQSNARESLLDELPWRRTVMPT